MYQDLFDQTVSGMHTLYDSESFVVVHMQSSPLLSGADSILMQGRDHLALARNGFEIVDKRSGRHVFLDGSWAELFQQQIAAWQDNTPTQEEVDDTLEDYAVLACSPVRLH